MTGVATAKPRRSKRTNLTPKVATFDATGCELEALIRQRAYFLWEDEGRPQGRETEHWQRATAELQKKPQR
jgi:Protein of unknown function (DUF2934)